MQEQGFIIIYWFYCIIGFFDLAGAAILNKTRAGDIKQQKIYFTIIEDLTGAYMRKFIEGLGKTEIDIKKSVKHFLNFFENYFTWGEQLRFI